MFVCVCHGITDKQIKQVVRENSVGNMRDLKRILNVGASCGTCVQMAQAIINTTIVDESLFKDVG